MQKLYLYTSFHLNIAFSSIPEEEYPIVIERCFWPLLEICEKTKVQIGIEAPGYTLEKINEISPSWINKLKNLWKKGVCEFIGSGYSQLLGPLVPAKVNEQNLKIGHQVYQSLLGQKPQIAFMNEQAYSPGLIEHYLNADYKAIIMEWNNPYRYHPKWSKKWQYYPQLAIDQSGKNIPVIWSNSIAFQKFQRYAQGEIELNEYMDYIISHLGEPFRCFPLYSNDVEIFDYRPGRYDTEVEICENGEWHRIERLFYELASHPAFEMISPSKILDVAEGEYARNRIALESPEDPIPVKKQEKYNITRWAVTGRDNVGNNTKCYRIYEHLERLDQVNEKCRSDVLWKELCYLWSSDFRTHIEEKKYLKFQDRLDKTLDRISNMPMKIAELPCIKDHVQRRKIQPSVIQQGKIIFIETESLKVTLSTRRGLTVDSLIFKGVSNQPLVGTLPHGYYDDISLGADYYTGHTIIEIPGRSKITDLENVELNSPVNCSEREDFISIEGTVKTRLGKVNKKIQIYLSEMRLDICYSFDLDENPLATFRTGIITFIPDAFDRDTLYYSAHNGGKTAESHKLKGHRVSHGESVSAIVSAKHCLGATEGWVEIGDKDKKIKVFSDKSKLYSVPMIDYREVEHGSYFIRLMHSIGEIDDTAKKIKKQKRDITFSIYCEHQDTDHENIE